MKIAIRIAAVVALLVAGFAAGFPMGRYIGFSTGCEWSLIQAEILARESGMFMPIRYEEGKFRVTYKQPPHLHKRAWKLADKHEDVSLTPQKCGSVPVTRTAFVTRKEAPSPVQQAQQNSAGLKLSEAEQKYPQEGDEANL